MIMGALHRRIYAAKLGVKDVETEDIGEIQSGEEIQSEEEGQYLVMWHTWQPVPKRGFWNKLLGRKIRLLQPMVHTYDSLEVAEYGYDNIKSNKGYSPCILKVIKS